MWKAVGWPGGERTEQAVEGLRVVYSLQADSEIQLLDHLQWADWGQDGQLLAATRSGRFQVWNVDCSATTIVFDKDLFAAYTESTRRTVVGSAVVSTLGVCLPDFHGRLELPLPTLSPVSVL